MTPMRILKAMVADSPALRGLLVTLRGPYKRSESHLETGATVDQRYGDGANDWSTMKSFSHAGRYGAMAEWIRRLAPQGPVLDIGAGNGLLAEALAGLEVDYLGVDFAAATIEAVGARPGGPKRLFSGGRCDDLRGGAPIPDDPV